MKPKLLLLTTLITAALFNSANAQSLKEQFKETYAKNNSDATLKLLNNWRKSNPNDPELYVCYYNFYAQEGMKEVLAMTTKQPAGESIVINDKSGKAVGYLGGTGRHNDAYLQKGFNYIDTGIAKFPNRLDMRFGKTYVLGQLKDYKQFTAEIIKTISYGESIGLKWAWTDGKMLDDPKEFMLSNIQSYLSQMFNDGAANIPYIKDVAQTVLKYHPDHVESLSDLAISYIVNKDYNGALEPLLKAEKINPQDFIVLNNIAYAYSEMGDKPNAIKYYELVDKYGDAEAKETAKEKLEMLKK